MVKIVYEIETEESISGYPRNSGSVSFYLDQKDGFVQVSNRFCYAASEHAQVVNGISIGKLSIDDVNTLIGYLNMCKSMIESKAP